MEKNPLENPTADRLLKEIDAARTALDRLEDAIKSGKFPEAQIANMRKGIGHLAMAVFDSKLM